MNVGDLIGGDEIQILWQECHVVGYMQRKMATKRRWVGLHASGGGPHAVRVSRLVVARVMMALATV